MSFLRYLPPDADESPWGITPTAGGEYTALPNEPYPNRRELHPDTHWFLWEDGRVFQEMALLLIRNGEGVFESSAAGTLEIRHGTLFFLHPGVWHRYRPHPEMGYEEAWVTFRGEYAEKLVQEYFPPNAPLIYLPDPEEIHQLIADLHRVMQKGLFRHNRLVAKARLLEIIAQAQQQISFDPAPNSLDQRIEKACKYLLGCPNEVEWEQLAQRTGLSLSHFRRKFREKTGYSPHDYWCHVRMNRIKQQLLTTESTLEELAERFNFHDPAHLSKTFKKLAGVSPSQYRKQLS